MVSRKRQVLKTMAYILLFAMLLLGAERWMTRNAARGAAPAIDEMSLSGKHVLLSQWSGQSVLIHFWATWCPVCGLEHGAINALAHDYPVIGIAMQSGDSAAVSEYVRERGIEYEVIVDEAGDIATRYGVTAVPMSFIIGPEGRVRYVTRGITTGPGLRARLELAGRAN